MKRERSLPYGKTKKPVCNDTGNIIHAGMANGTRTLAFQVSEELFTRIKEHLKKTGQSQKDFVITLIEQALQDAEKNEEEAPE